MNIVLDGRPGGEGFVAGNHHLLSALAGAGIAFLLLGLFWRSGALGGGDVKLAVAIGAIKGFKFAVWAIACGSLVGAFLAIGMMAARGRFKEGMVSAGRLAARPWMWGRKLEEGAAPVIVPYGLAFALGSLWVWAIW
jgi:Flp pilus assembly protein protease CpaA